jgi:hypothetical protein
MAVLALRCNEYALCSAQAGVDSPCTLYVHCIMAGLSFTWDAAKARANVAKHGIRFEEAETAFSDENAILFLSIRPWRRGSSSSD